MTDTRELLEQVLDALTMLEARERQEAILATKNIIEAADSGRDILVKAHRAFTKHIINTLAEEGIGMLVRTHGNYNASREELAFLEIDTLPLIVVSYSEPTRSYTFTYCYDSTDMSMSLVTDIGLTVGYLTVTDYLIASRAGEVLYNALGKWEKLINKLFY